MERISKMWRSALAMALAICMVLSFCPVAAFAAEEEITYVSLGDSMTNGYGFTGYKQGAGANILTGNGMYGDAAYPNLFAQWLAKDGATVDHIKLAPSGMRAEELNYLLGGREMPTDVWGIDQLEHYSGVSDHGKLKKLYQDSIAEADVITMGVGNASFGAYMVQYFTRMLGVMGGSLPESEKVDLDKALVVLTPEQQSVIMKAYNQMKSMVASYLPGELGPIEDVNALIEMMAYISAGFLLNYEGALDQIVALNPNVEVVLVGLMNTTYGMVVTGEGFDPIPIGKIVDVMFKALNAYIAALPTAKQALGRWENAKFYYADMPNPEFIVQVFDDLAEAGWPADLNGLSGATVRSRTIDAYNYALRPMLMEAMKPLNLPVITIDDVANYEFDEVCAGNGNGYQILNQFFAELEQLMNGAALATLPLVNRYISNTGDTSFAHVEEYVVGVFGAEVEKEISIAIYVALEESLVKSVGTMEITLDGLLGMTGNVLEALGEMPASLSSNPSPKVLRDDLIAWFTGSDTGLAMCKIFAMFKVGDGMSVHPTPKAHANIYASVKNAYGKHTAKDETVENINYVLGELKNFLEKYGPEAADQAYKLWVDKGYQALVDQYITELTTNVTDRYTNYTEVVLPAINSALDALNAQKITLTTELATLKTQLLAKKAELEKVLAEQEITDITPPEFDIDTELGNNEQTQVPENDCAGTGNVADELQAAIADLEHAISVVEALIADVTADIEDMVALATEIAEGVATLEQTLTDVAAAAQDLKNAVDAVVAVLTDDAAKATSKTFMKAFNAARDAALIAVDTVEMLVETVNGDVATIEASIATLEECANALANKFAEDKEAILMQIAKDIPTDALMIVGPAIMLVQQTLEANKDEIISGMNTAKDALLTELSTQKDAILLDLNNQKDAILKDLGEKKAALAAEYGPQIDEALLQLNTLKDQINNEIQTKYAELQADAQTQIDALKLDAQTKIDTLNLELQGYMAQLAGDISDELRAEIQPQIDRINNDIAAINADLACAIEHVNAELKAAHDALVEEVTNTYNDVMTELQNAYDALVDAYNTAVKQLQDAADEAIKALQDAADEAIKALQDAYDEAVKQLQDEADKAIQDLIDAAQKELDELGKVGEILSELMDSVLAAIHGDVAKAQAAINEILHGALDSVNDLADALVDVGIDTVNTIVDEVTKVINDMLHEATHADLELGAESLYIALGDGTAAPESYVEKLAAQLEAEYGVENYTNYAQAGNTAGAEVAKVADRAGIADADLITIGFGNATIVETAIRNADSVEYDWAGLVGADLVPYVEDALAEVYAEIANADMSEDMAEFVNSIVEGLAYGAVEYAVELPALIAAIREVNADAVIVIVGQYNPLEDVVLEMGGSTLDLSEYIGYFVDAVAVHGIGYAMITGDAIFVEAPEVDTNNTDTSWSETDLLKMLMNQKGFEVLNPSESGDTYITNQILGALNITKIEVPVLLGDVNDDGVVDGRDIIRLAQYDAGIEGKVINKRNSDVNCDGIVDGRDLIRLARYDAGIEGVVLGK